MTKFLKNILHLWLRCKRLDQSNCWIL